VTIFRELMNLDVEKSYFEFEIQNSFKKIQTC